MGHRKNEHIQKYNKQCRGYSKRTKCAWLGWGMRRGLTHISAGTTGNVWGGVQRHSYSWHDEIEKRKTQPECQENISYIISITCRGKLEKSCYLKTRKTRLNEPPILASPSSLCLDLKISTFLVLVCICKFWKLGVPCANYKVLLSFNKQWKIPWVGV